MAFGSGFNNFFNGVYEGLTTADDLKDYRHASKLFLSDGYALAPQTKFLFHVYFTLNTAEIPGLRNAFSTIQDTSTIGMMVKTADLPKFNIDVSEFNQYNRKRYVQGKINYEPVNITFHDDGSDLVRSMWNAYYSYYYQDSLHQYDGVTNADLSGAQSPLDFNRRDIYDNLRNVNNWGYDGAGNASGYKPNFFKDIKIFGMNRGNFTQYTLINPIITNWAHDQFDYSQGGGTMSNQVTLRYETVKYARGAIGSAGDSNVKGWGDPSTYDNEPSQFGKAGSVASITGAGGLLDAGASVIDDLASGNILGALVTGATAYETFSDFDFGAAFESEGTDVATGVLTAVAASPTVTNAVNNFVFPKPESTQNTQLPTAAATMFSNGGLTSSSNTTPPTNSNWLNPDLNFNNRASNPADVNSNGAPVNSQWVNPDE
jgi:hypothetical protein